MVNHPERSAAQADDDAALVARARSGDDAARDALIARHMDAVYGVVFRLLGDHDRAADAAQDALVRALRGLGGFRGEAQFRTWLLRIAVNAARSAGRTTSRRREVALTLVDERADSAPDPATRAVLRSEAERAAALLQKLPTKQRETVTLRAAQGLDYEAIGQILGCSAGTARVNYYHGIRRLRELMG